MVFVETTFSEADDVGGHTVEIPALCFKLSHDVCNEKDLLYLLHTVRFWLIPEHIEYNEDVFALALSDRRCIINALTEFAQTIPFLTELSAATEPSAEFTLMGNAARLGMLSFAKYLMANGHSWDCGPGKHSQF